MSPREIALIGGVTFLVVSAATLILLPNEKAAAEADASIAVAASLEQTETEPSAPRPLALGVEPSVGANLDGEDKRRQIVAFLSEAIGEPSEVIDAVEVSGSQRTEYCGTARPASGGAVRSWSIILWSDAPMEHTISNEPADCPTGRPLIRDGLAIPWETAQAELEDELRRQPETSSGTPAGAVTGGLYDEIDRVSTYAVLIGRGAACGVDTRAAASRVGVWLDRVAPPGSEAQLTLLPMFMRQSHYHAQQQASGRSPDDCASVARAIRSYPWPS